MVGKQSAFKNALVMSLQAGVPDFPFGVFRIQSTPLSITWQTDTVMVLLLGMGVSL